MEKSGTADRENQAREQINKDGACYRKYSGTTIKLRFSPRVTNNLIHVPGYKNLSEEEIKKLEKEGKITKLKADDFNDSTFIDVFIRGFNR